MSVVSLDTEEAPLTRGPSDVSLTALRAGR